MILAATGNRYQLDLVEQAMKKQFPDDETRNHDDRTGKYHNNILGGDVNEDDDHLTRTEQEQERTVRKILTHWPRHSKKKQTLWHPWPQQTEHSRMLEKHHQVRVSRGQYPQKQGQRESTNKTQERTCVICSGHTWFHSVQKSKGNHARTRERRQPMRRTANLLCLCTQKRACSQARGALDTGKALIDCGATRSMASGSPRRVGTHK